MNLFFDIIIFSFLIVALVLAATLIHQWFDGRREKKSTRRQILILAAAIVVSLSFSVVFYGSFIEPRLISLNYETIRLNPEGKHKIRLALVSDLHAGPYVGSGIVRSVFLKLQAINPKPDAIIYAGDFISGKNSNLAKLEELGKSDEPIFAVLGNHDYLEDAETLQKILGNFNIRILKNENVILEKDGAKIALVGIDDLWFGHPDLNQAGEGIPADMPKILVSHNPDIVLNLGDLKFDAVLSAHTHGGQIRLPLIGSIMPIPTILGRLYDRGVFYWRGMPLVITRGIGETGPRARLFNRPEIMVIDFFY